MADNNINIMKKVSRNWSPEEDQMLVEAMALNQEKKLKWEEVAALMNEKNNKCQKTGKQCRERWHNQLAPELNNSGKWTESENDILFEWHGKLGNKWAKIASHLPGRTDNCVKNHFYSTLRRGMRQVNLYIHEARKERSSLKQFKPDVLTKILIVADGDPEQKLNAKNEAHSLSQEIKKILISISLAEDDTNTQEIQKVMGMIMEFNKNCKKRKGKKKGSAAQKDDSDSEIELDYEHSKSTIVKMEQKKDTRNKREQKQQRKEIVSQTKKGDQMSAFYPELIEVEGNGYKKKKDEEKDEERTGLFIESLGKSGMENAKGIQVLKKSSLDSVQSIDDKIFMGRAIEFDMFRSSGCEALGRFLPDPDQSFWGKRSGLGLFTESCGAEKFTFQGERGVINADMIQSKEYPGVFNEMDLQKSKAFDNLSFIRDVSVVPSPALTVYNQGFKSFEPKCWAKEEDDKE